MSRIVLFFELVFVGSICGATFHVAQVTNASDKNSGSSELPFQTISRAATLARPGDMVIVHGGVYRECVRPVRGGTGPDKMITYQAAKGEEVIIRGSKVFTPAWKPAAPEKGLSDFVCADLPESIFEPNPRYKKADGTPTIYNPFRISLMVELYNPPDKRYKVRGTKEATRQVVGEVFVRGKPLFQVRTRPECEARPGTFYIAPDGKTLFVHFMKFTQGPVELTVREQCFVPEFRGMGYIRVSGFVMEQCANQGPFPQAGILSTRSGHHWIIENNIIRYAATVGIDCGSELACFYLYPKNSTKVEGPWAPGSTPAIYEVSHEKKGWSPLSDFVVQPAPAVGHVVRNNIVSDNGLCGIMAIKADDLLIEGNTVERNNRRNLYAGVEEYAAGTCESGGIKLHITKNAVIRNNLIRDQYGWGAGIWLDNSNDNAHVAGNLILNNWVGVDLEINTEPIWVENNIIAFSKLDGLSSRDSSRVKFVHNTVLYSGRWGCMINYSAQRGSFLSRTFGPPRNCLVANNVFAGGVEKGAIRIPMPTKEIHDNVVSGNLIHDGQTEFQLEDFRQNVPFSFKDFVATATYWLTENKLPKNLWPDFNSWKVNDPWNAGVCSFMVFNAITGGADNHYRNFQIPDIFCKMDQFSGPSPSAWPAREYLLPNLKPEYMFLGDASTWPVVTAVKEVDRDYFGKTTGSNGSKQVLPGAIQKIERKKNISLWPKSND
jgi:parallel beta-helix repeat protein